MFSAHIINKYGPTINLCLQPLGMSNLSDKKPYNKMQARRIGF